MVVFENHTDDSNESMVAMLLHQRSGGEALRIIQGGELQHQDLLFKIQGLQDFTIRNEMVMVCIV